MKLRTIYVDTVDVMYNLIWCFILLWSCYLLFQGVGSYICGVNWRQLVMSGCILSLLWIWGCVHNVCALLTFIFWQSHNVLYHIISCFHNVFLAASIVRWWKGAYNWAQGFLSSHILARELVAEALPDNAKKKEKEKLQSLDVLRILISCPPSEI